ncbi:metal ABC transporter substrate-binding protein [Streptomyces sp. NPDC015144]|uniref:metal ABC transporter substrate-binding protein n=1 Tax=Streptomyces sp. NPDC015144 TaxID=3364944 RepID=UPI0036F6E253
MNISRLVPVAAVATAAALGLTALTGCSAADGADGKKGDGLDVVASFYPMQFLAERIGGEHVSVTTLTKPGQEPHDLELSPRQIGGLTDAGLVLYLKGIQPAVDDAIGLSGAKHVLDASTLTTLEDHGTEVGADDHGHEHHGDEAGADPHVWLDPVKYAEVAKGVGKSLEKADPAHAADYRKNTTALVARLDELNTAFEDGLRSTATRTFITTHSAFGYLAERYGLTQEGIAGVDPEADPSPARINEIHAIAKKDKATTVFFETLASDRTARTLAKDTGLRTDVLDPLEGITKQSKGTDYLEVMRSNLAALQKALGAK